MNLKQRISQLRETGDVTVEFRLPHSTAGSPYEMAEEPPPDPMVDINVALARATEDDRFELFKELYQLWVSYAAHGNNAHRAEAEQIFGPHMGAVTNNMVYYQYGEQQNGEAIFHIRCWLHISERQCMQGAYVVTVRGVAAVVEQYYKAAQTILSCSHEAAMV